jgi:hypothetical protein
MRTYPKFPNSLKIKISQFGSTRLAGTESQKVAGGVSGHFCLVKNPSIAIWGKIFLFGRIFCLYSFSPIGPLLPISILIATNNNQYLLNTYGWIEGTLHDLPPNPVLDSAAATTRITTTAHFMAERSTDPKRN